MGWLISSTLASIVISLVVVKIFDWIFAGVTDGLLSIPRAGLFVGTWTAVTAKAGMSGFSKRVRQLRLSKIFGRKEGR